MIYGYLKIYTKSQSLQRQKKIIKKYAEENNIQVKIYEEGTIKTDKKIYSVLKKKLSHGDTLICDSIIRINNTLFDLIKEYCELHNKGINLIFVKEQYLNTENYVNKDLIIEQITRTFEKYEKRQLKLKAKISDALKIKKKQGIALGRKKGSKIETKKSKEMKEKIEILSRDFNGTLTDSQLIEVLKIGRNTYFKYKKEMKLKGD